MARDADLIIEKILDADGTPTQEAETIRDKIREMIGKRFEIALVGFVARRDAMSRSDEIFCWVIFVRDE